MISIVRTDTLRSLRAELAATTKKLDAATEELNAAKDEAEIASNAAKRVKAVAKQQLGDLAQAHAARFQAERERDRARDDARREAQQQLAELGEDLARLRDAAADTETGLTVRAAIAYRVLRDLITNARANGQDLDGALSAVAMVLGFDTDPNPRSAGT